MAHDIKPGSLEPALDRHHLTETPSSTETYEELFSFGNFQNWSGIWDHKSECHCDMWMLTVTSSQLRFAVKKSEHISIKVSVSVPLSLSLSLSLSSLKEKESQVDQDNPKLPLKLRMTLNFQSCLHLLSAGIIGAHHYIRFMQYWGSNSGLCSC